VVGAFAVAFHGFPRYTADLDLLVRPTEDNADRVLRFEYYLHRTLALHAAPDTKTGRCRARRRPSHQPRFCRVLGAAVTRAHRTRLRFTPAYSSWLTQIEIWSAKIEREVITRGVFTSCPDMARKLRRYINAYSANACSRFAREICRCDAPQP
jgi:hypothetical protein